MCIFIIYYYIRAVGSKLKVVRPESAGSHCGRGFLHVDVVIFPACNIQHPHAKIPSHNGSQQTQAAPHEILSLLLVAFQCTGSCREWLQW